MLSLVFEHLEAEPYAAKAPVCLVSRTLLPFARAALYGDIDLQSASASDDEMLQPDKPLGWSMHATESSVLLCRTLLSSSFPAQTPLGQLRLELARPERSPTWLRAKFSVHHISRVLSKFGGYLKGLHVTIPLSAISRAFLDSLLRRLVQQAVLIEVKETGTDIYGDADTRHFQLRMGTGIDGENELQFRFLDCEPDAGDLVVLATDAVAGVIVSTYADAVETISYEINERIETLGELLPPCSVLNTLELECFEADVTADEIASALTQIMSLGHRLSRIQIKLFEMCPPSVVLAAVELALDAGVGEKCGTIELHWWVKKDRDGIWNADTIRSSQEHVMRFCSGAAPWPAAAQRLAAGGIGLMACIYGVHLSTVSIKNDVVMQQEKEAAEQKDADGKEEGSDR